MSEQQSYKKQIASEVHLLLFFYVGELVSLAFAHQDQEIQASPIR